MYYITIFDDDGSVKKHVHTAPFIVYNTKFNVTFSITIESPAFYALQADTPVPPPPKKKEKKNRVYMCKLFDAFDT